MASRKSDPLFGRPYGTFSDNRPASSTDAQDGLAQDLSEGSPLIRRGRSLGMSTAFVTIAALAFMMGTLVLYNDSAAPHSSVGSISSGSEESGLSSSKGMSGPKTAAQPGQGNEDASLKAAPHLVFFMVDDQGYNDIGYNSNDLSFATPFIDKMASRGIKFDRYYTMHLCTPARSALMTGMYPIHTGMHHDVIQPSAPWGLPLEHSIMPHYLKQAGYLTHMVGKWHLGFYNESFMPTARGFETYTGYLGDQEHYSTHKYDRTQEDKNTHSKYFYDFISTKEGSDSFELLARKEGVANVSSAVIFVEEASRILENNKDSSAPLFLYLAWQNVHGPLDMVSAEYLKENLESETIDHLHSVPMRTRRHFAAITVQLDISIEKVYNAVEKTIGLENTLFLYASDNGGCKDAGGYNTPLRGGKHFLYEGGVRVPAFISGKILPSTGAESAYQPLFHVSDWLTTMFGVIDDSTGKDYSNSVLGAANLDGVNHWESLKQASTTAYLDGPRTELLINIDRWHTPSCHGGDDDEICTESLEPLGFSRGAFIRGHMKFILNEYENSWFSPLTQAQWHSYGEEDFSDTGRSIADCVADYANPIRNKLFNITADPFEEVNLLSEKPEMASEFQRYLEEMEIATPAWQPSFSAEASGVWEKTDMSLVPWCELECMGTHQKR